jgi:TonB family protein
VAETYAVFGSCLLFKEVVADDLGHLFRAGVIVDGAIERTVWLRLFDRPGLPREAIASSLGQAREIGGLLSGSQVAAGPLFIEAGGVSAIGGEFVAGQPLNHVLQRARDEAFPLQPDNCLLIAEKLALALVAGEAVQIGGRPLAHGFLHPGLVCLSYDGDATIFGFGLGEALLGAVGVPDGVPGARAYLAPEVLAGGGASLRGDVYSVGAILFHLLTGTALPAAPGEREAALAGAFLAWDGEALPSDIRSLLGRALAASPAGRFPSAAALRTELDRLLYGGAYSPTTFNLALFMDRLFRAEIEAEELERQRERELDPADYVVAAPGSERAAIAAGEGGSARSTTGVVPEAVEPLGRPRRRVGLWAAIGGVVVIGAVAASAWFWWAGQPKEQPPTPEEIAAARQAQEDRLRTMTQEMVQEMMAQREEEIRQELSARQARIEELQRRLQQSERRAATSTAAAADEAATQQALLRELQEQEEEQRKQQEALEAERREETEAVDGQAATSGPETAPVEPAPIPTPPVEPTATAAAPAAQPTARPTAAAAAAARTVKAGEFVAPEDVDTPPVVVKSQALEWPRNAARSKGKGVVVVKLTVNASGGVDDVEVMRADHMGWGIPEAALAAAASYRYKPGTKNGVPIATYAFVTWRYDFTEQ